MPLLREIPAHEDYWCCEWRLVAMLGPMHASSFFYYDNRAEAMEFCASVRREGGRAEVYQRNKATGMNRRMRPHQ